MDAMTSRFCKSAIIILLSSFIILLHSCRSVLLTTQNRPNLEAVYSTALPNGGMWIIYLYDDMTFTEINHNGTWHGVYAYTTESFKKTLLRREDTTLCVDKKYKFSQCKVVLTPVKPNETAKVMMFDFSGKQLELHHLCFSDKDGKVLYGYSSQRDTGSADCAIPPNTAEIEACGSINCIPTVTKCGYSEGHNVYFLLYPTFSHGLELSEDRDTLYYVSPDCHYEHIYDNPQKIKLIRQNTKALEDSHPNAN